MAVCKARVACSTSCAFAGGMTAIVRWPVFRWEIRSAASCNAPPETTRVPSEDEGGRTTSRTLGALKKKARKRSRTCGDIKLSRSRTGSATSDTRTAEGSRKNKDGLSPTNTSCALRGRSSGRALRHREIVFTQRCGMPRKVNPEFEIVPSDRLAVVTFVSECERVETVLWDWRPATIS